MAENDFDSSQEEEQSHPIIDKRPLKGLWIPIEILMNSDLSSTEKLLFSEILALDNLKSGCIASNDYLARMFDLSPIVVSQIIGKLKDKKLVEQENFDGRKRTLKTNKQMALIGHAKKLQSDIDKIIAIEEKATEEKDKPKKDQTISNGKLRLNKKLKSDLGKWLTIVNSEANRLGLIKTISKEIEGKSKNDFPISENKPTISRWKRNAPIKVKRNNRHEQQSRLKPEKKQKEKKISILPGTDAERIVNYWNNLKSPNSRFKFIVHKRLNSNCMADTVKWIEELRKGKFASVNGKNWRQDFFEKNHIPFPLTEPIMPREIYHLMNIYLDFFKDGFWPENKKHLPTTLPDFILSGNPKTGKTSYLLRCKFNPPGRMNGKPVDYRPEYTDVFKQFGLLRDIDEDDMQKVYSGIQSIENRILREKLFNWKDVRIKMRFGKCEEKGMEGLFEDYANFILDEYNNWELDEVFNQWGKVFKDWLRTRQQEFDF